MSRAETDKLFGNVANSMWSGDGSSHITHTGGLPIETTLKSPSENFGPSFYVHFTHLGLGNPLLK